jgi:hypothetical protein
MKTRIIFLLAVMFGVVAVFSDSDVHALSGGAWSVATPRIVKRSQLKVDPDSRCPTYKQEVFVTELGSAREACLYGDERLKIGIIHEGNETRAVVGFSYSATMHILGGICFTVCRYSADTDTLVTQELIGQYTWGLVVFSHVSERIQRTSVSAATTEYTFDTRNPDYKMKNETGRFVSTQSFALSNNGKWIVVELRDKGIAVIDTRTLTVRQVTAEGYRYGFGMDPFEELAVSDDGLAIVVAGQNAGFQVFDTLPTCGQQLVADMSFLTETLPCPSSNLQVGTVFPNIASVVRPRFVGSVHQLEVVVKSWGESTQRVMFVTQGTPLAQQLAVLSLGDSFSSGEGELDDAYYIPGTNQDFDSCHVSSRAYPGVIATKLGKHDGDVKNVACSGAKITDVVGSGTGYWGQGDRLGSSGLKLSVVDKDIAQEQAIDSFQPGRASQLSFIQRYNPETITIGIGGNDAGLMGKLRACAMPGRCEWALSSGVEETAGEIRRLYDTLGSFFSIIAAEMEPSHVFIVGYPNIIDPEGICDSVTGFLMDQSERAFIKNSILYLNKIIHAATDKVGFMYVDVEHAFEGKNLCTGNQNSTMNGVRLGDDIAVLNVLPMLKIIGAETFHPTPIGHGLIADRLLSQYPGLQGGLSTRTPFNIDPDPYWHSEDIPDLRSAYVTDFAFKESDAVTHMSIAVPDGTLLPSSIATLEVRSEPTLLATFVVSEKGGLNGQVQVPSGLDEGFHTLHLFGVNRGGDAIDMYQFLTIGQAGVVLKASSGESAAGGSIGNSDKDSQSALLHPQSADPGLVAGAVLGLQSVSDSVPIIKKVVSPVVSYVEKNVTRVWWLLIVVCVVVSAILSTLLTIFLQRKWAKPRS